MRACLAKVKTQASRKREEGRKRNYLLLKKVVESESKLKVENLPEVLRISRGEREGVACIGRKRVRIKGTIMHENEREGGGYVRF